MCLQATQSALLVMPTLRYMLKGGSVIMEHLILPKEELSNHQLS